jgi:hypothetical protein
MSKLASFVNNRGKKMRKLASFVNNRGKKMRNLASFVNNRGKKMRNLASFMNNRGKKMRNLASFVHLPHSLAPYPRPFPPLAGERVTDNSVRRPLRGGSAPAKACHQGVKVPPGPCPRV